MIDEVPQKGIQFDHDAEETLASIGIDSKTTPEELDKQFESFLQKFYGEGKTSKRLELLSQACQEDPVVLLTVHHMVVHCVTQSQIAQQQMEEQSILRNKEVIDSKIITARR